MPVLVRAVRRAIGASAWGTAKAADFPASYGAPTPYATREEPGNHWIKTGAHVMIVGFGAKMLDGCPRDAEADLTKPYVMWPGTQYDHLMLPVR
jgi:hypothetical protein